MACQPFPPAQTVVQSFACMQPSVAARPVFPSFLCELWFWVSASVWLLASVPQSLSPGPGSPPRRAASRRLCVAVGRLAAVALLFPAAVGRLGEASVSESRVPLARSPPGRSCARVRLWRPALSNPHTGVAWRPVLQPVFRTQHHRRSARRVSPSHSALPGSRSGQPPLRGDPSSADQGQAYPPQCPGGRRPEYPVHRESSACVQARAIRRSRARLARRLPAALCSPGQGEPVPSGHLSRHWLPKNPYPSVRQGGDDRHGGVGTAGWARNHQPSIH
jgi:hypothetical protein